jgi:predicted MPP superfamily phosphohydrolase
LTAVIIFFILALILVAGYALFIETRMFRVSSTGIRVKRFIEHGMTVLHISDFHFEEGDDAKLRFLRGLHQEPVDFVVATGDMIDDDSGIPYCVEALRGFKTRLGTFAVFGAHDHWDTRLKNVILDLSLGGYRKGEANDFDRLKKELITAGIFCLENNAHRLQLAADPQEDVWIVGVDDMFAGLADFEKALSAVPPGAPKILLTHTVENPAELAALGFDAVFAGHSHGGQVRLPLIGAVITRSSLPRRYAHGSFEQNGTAFHINNGVGTGKWTGFRFLCPPEATYLKLIPGEEENEYL